MAFTLDFSGSVVAVTGVSSGIGQGIARMFARAGATVAGCGRSPGESDGAREFTRIVKAEGARAVYVQCDIAAESGPEVFVDAVLEEAGRIDTVVSNAGRNVFTGTADTTLEDWNECINLDLRAHWLLARAARTALQAAAADPAGPDRGKPSVLLNSSNHSMYTMPGCFPYNVAKAGMNALVQSLAIEWGPALRAVGVAPGFIETPGNRAWFDRFERPTEERARTAAIHPVGTLGTVDQIGAIFLFLASSYADFVTGTTWLADGGRSAVMQDQQ